MSFVPPPQDIAQALARASRAVASITPNVGFGSRSPRPFEHPQQEGSWTGPAQVLAMNVNWNTEYTVERGATTASRRSVPAFGISLRLATKMPDGKVHTWETRQYRIPLELQEITDERVLRKVQTEIAVVKGWMVVLLTKYLNPPPDERTFGDLLRCLELVHKIISTNPDPILVTARWTKQFYEIADPETKEVRKVESINDYLLMS